MSWQTDADWQIPGADGDDVEIDWERRMVKFRGVEVPLAPRWIREWLRKYGDPWCPNHDPIGCPCWSLVHRSGDVTDFPLSDLSHVSYLAGETLTEHWILVALEHGPWDPYDCVPVPVAEGIWTHPVRFHDMIELPDDGAPGWPVPILDSPYGVAIVIREWIEEPQDPRLGQVLDGMPQLAEVMEEVHTDEVRYWGSVDFSDEFATGLGSTIDLLRRFGLPASRTTALYLLGRTGRERDPLGHLRASFPTAPARGVEVVSFGLIPIGGQPFSEGTMLHQINSASPWRTTELVEGAAAAANRHSRWWQSIPQSRFVAADLRKFNGRREDDLSPLVSRFVHGKMSRTVLQAAAYEIRNARTEVEQARIRRALDGRIARAMMRAQRLT